MKSLWRKITSGALALAMMFTLAACGKENGGADAASVMAAAQQEMAKVSSMRYTYAMEMGYQRRGSAGRDVCGRHCRGHHEPLRRQDDHEHGHAGYGA